MNVLICDPISPKGIALFQQRPEFKVTVLEKRLTEAELLPLVSETDAMVVRKVAQISARSTLKVVGRVHRNNKVPNAPSKAHKARGSAKAGGATTAGVVDVVGTAAAIVRKEAVRRAALLQHLRRLEGEAFLDPIGTAGHRLHGQCGLPERCPHSQRGLEPELYAGVHVRHHRYRVPARCVHRCAAHRRLPF